MDDVRPIIVMKFGGTSVADKNGREAITARVQATLEAGKAPVLVVSAMGRAGDPYATDTLLELVTDLPEDLRERDLLMASGEIISAVVCAHELRSRGVAARAYTGAEAGITTNGAYGSSAIEEIHPGALLSAIRQSVIPVIAGFQGVAQDGTLTTLGRGGSDTTACALGVALEAAAVEIYTDVDGVMSADPRTCAGVRVLETIRADELFQMALHGARVVHTPAAELALTSGITIRVRNTFTAHPGTEVADIAAYRPTEVATAVTHIDGVARLRVALPTPEGTPSHMDAQARVYRAMADAGVSLDMFTPAGENLLLSVGEGALDRAISVLGELDVPHEVQAGLAKVTLVGAGMHGIPGVMARMSEYLRDAGVTVLQTADSHTTISVLVTADDAPVAVRALHDGFELGEH